MVWYAGNKRTHIGRFDPETGAVEKYPMPDPDARDPHTLVFDGDGHIWFTMQNSNMVGRLTMHSGQIELIRIPTDRARPYGIKIAPDGSIWVVLFGTNMLAHIDPVEFTLTLFELPNASARPRRLEITNDGTVWYVDYSGGMVGRYEPDAGTFKEWPIPGDDNHRPYGTALDNNGVFWFVDGATAPNQLFGFDTRTTKFVSQTSIPSGGGTVRHMYFHEPSGEIWFGTDANTIGRVIISE